MLRSNKEMSSPQHVVSDAPDQAGPARTAVAHRARRAVRPAPRALQGECLI